MNDNNKFTFNLDRPLLKKILIIITYTLILYWGLTRFEVVQRIFSRTMSILTPFIIGFCIAFIINVLLRPMERQWDKLFKKAKAQKFKRPVCLVLSAIIVLGIIFALLFMIIPEFSSTLAMFIEALPANIARTQVWVGEILDSLNEHGIVLPRYEFDMDKLISNITRLASEYGHSIIDKTAGATVTIFSGLVNIVIAFVLSIYMLSQKEALCRQLKKLLYALVPEKKADKAQKEIVFINKTFTSFVTGQLTEALIIGIMCFIGMLIFRIPYAPVVSVLVGFTSLIPIIGAFVGTAIGVFLILLTAPMKALWFVIFIIVLQQIEGNLIYPKVVGKSVGLPGIWVLTAVTIGGNLFGFLGMLLCVPVFSIIYAYVRRFTNNQLDEKNLSIK